MYIASASSSRSGQGAGYGPELNMSKTSANKDEGLIKRWIWISTGLVDKLEQWLAYYGPEDSESHQIYRALQEQRWVYHQHHMEDLSDPEWSFYATAISLSETLELCIDSHNFRCDDYCDYCRLCIDSVDTLKWAKSQLRPNR
jgi:hypothetical protein